MNRKRDIRLLLSLAGALLLAGCQNNSVEPVDDDQQSAAVELIPMNTPFLEVHRMGSRADYENLPSGYLPYNDLYPTTKPEHKTIGVFMTPEKTNSLGDFIYEEGNVWKSTVRVNEGTQYYIYGFMPREDADNAVITTLPGHTSYADGAVLTILNYRTLTPADVCAVVGVRNATAAEQISGPQSPVNLGTFGYLGGPEGDNRIFVLLKHLYAGIHLKGRIGARYHKMRDIKIRRVELVANDITEFVNLTVRLTANNTGTDPIGGDGDIIYESAGDPHSTNTVELFNSQEGYMIPETDPEGFLGCYAPGSCTSFTLRTYYDVYDKAGNLVRENCKAENTISNALFGTLNAGDVITVDMLINPDYLYQLSEPDADNPTIVLTIP
ncbi:MAG: hypothetical protein IJ148_02155 [Bacteroidaceae bacterium]|nr:hypothetical protein [Bacteroidaceae bacterium]